MKSPPFNRIDGAAMPLFVPCIAWLCYVFLVVPSLIVIPIAFGSSSELQFPPKTLSLQLFQRFFSDPGWWGSLLQSTSVALVTTALTLVLCLPAAYAVQRSSLWGRQLFNAITMGPLLVPVIVLGLGLYLQFGRWGILNQTVSIVLAHTMLAVPFAMVSIMAGFSHIDPALESAALVMGASKTRIFFKVLLPQLRTSLIAGGFFAFLISFDEVVVSFFLTGPQTQTLPVKMYAALRWEVSPVIAAVATLLTFVSLAFGMAIMKTQSDEPSATH